MESTHDVNRTQSGHKSVAYPGSEEAGIRGF